MRTGGWLRGIAHTLETADQRRAMRSAADRPSAACRASNAATGSAEGRLPASGAKSRVVATTGMGMRGSRSGAFNYSRRTIPPLVSFGDYIYEYLFASPFHARYFHRSAVSIRPTPLSALALVLALDRSALLLKSRRSFRKSRGKSAVWSVELVEPATVKFPELLVGMRLYHCEQVRRLSGKVHLIATAIKLFKKKNNRSNY